MLCEIEFLAVGESSRAGDCIVVRYGDVNDYKLMVVDGGTAETGEALVKHLKAQFDQKAKVEHVVLTHSDADHASGLRELLREIPVSNLWLHVPWLHAKEAIDLSLFKDGRWTEAGLMKAIKDQYDIIAEIMDLAIEKKVQIFEPYQGGQDFGAEQADDHAHHCDGHAVPAHADRIAMEAERHVLLEHQRELLRVPGLPDQPHRRSAIQFIGRSRVTGLLGRGGHGLADAGRQHAMKPSLGVRIEVVVAVTQQLGGGGAAPALEQAILHALAGVARDARQRIAGATISSNRQDRRADHLRLSEQAYDQDGNRRERQQSRSQPRRPIVRVHEQLSERFHRRRDLSRILLLGWKTRRQRL